MCEGDSPLKLIDTHAHLEDVEHLDEALARAEESGIDAVVTMGADSKSNSWALNESTKHERPGLKIFRALGIHPSLVDASKVDDDVQFVEDNADRVVAVGEIGLDYWYKAVRKDEEKRALQRITFARLLEVARKHGKPVSIHSRGAWTDCVNMTVEAGVKKAVFHWFTGSQDDLKKLLDSGYYVSASPAAAYSKEHRAIVEYAPLERILLETDSPVSYKGEAANPSFVLKALAAVAELKKERQEKVAEATTENAETVFGIS
jgi:TatD DNase family protein